MIKNLDKKLFDIPINWASISAFAFFWSYGYFGAVSFRELSFIGNIFISVVFYGVFLLFLLLSHYYKNLYRDSLTIYTKDVVVFAFFLAIMFVLSFQELTGSLVGDPLAHSQESQRHIVTILLKLPAMTSALNHFIFSNVLFVLNLLSIGFLALLYFIFKNKSFITKVVLLSVGFFVFRVAIIMLGSYATPHPTLRLFPLWLSSSLFSSTNFSFRLPQFLGLVVFMWIAQRIVSRKLSLLCSCLFGLAIGTIPLLWHVGTLVEQSIWTAVTWSIFLLLLVDNDDLSDFKWIRWFSIISLCALLRQTAFLALVPLFIFYIIYVFRKIRYDFKRLFFVLVPALLFFPVIIRSFIFGTPATYVFSESVFMPQGASSIERVWLAINSGIAPWIILNTVLLPWAIFPFFAFLPCFRSFRKNINMALTFVFFVLVFCMFYSIRTVLWGADRYQAEYIVPFAIMGFYRLFVKLNSTGRLVSKFLIAGLVFMIFYNVFIFKNLHNLYMAQERYQGVAIQSESVYNYSGALKAVKDEGYAGHAYIIGITYGILPEIMNGFTIEETISTKNLFDHQMEIRNLRKMSFTKIDVEAINSSPEIEIVLISDIGQSQEGIIKGLQTLGWKSWKNFKDNRSGTIIYGMKRGHS